MTEIFLFELLCPPASLVVARAALWGLMQDRSITASMLKLASATEVARRGDVMTSAVPTTTSSLGVWTFMFLAGVGLLSVTYMTIKQLGKFIKTLPRLLRPIRSWEDLTPGERKKLSGGPDSMVVNRNSFNNKNNNDVPFHRDSECSYLSANTPKIKLHPYPRCG